MSDLLNNGEESVYYVIHVHGKPVSAKFSSPQMAEMQIQTLSEAHQSIAEVVAVTESGSQLLLG